METIKEKIIVIIGIVLVIALCCGAYYMLVYQSSDYYTQIDNTKVDTSPTPVDTEGRESFDNEVAHKVAMTISCLLGAQTFGENRPFQQGELIPYAKALENEKVAQRNKTIFVILLLEGDFQSGTRTKKMNMDRIQLSIEKKLKWLNCKVSVVDAGTYRSDLFEVERIT